MGEATKSCRCYRRARELSDPRAWAPQSQCGAAKPQRGLGSGLTAVHVASASGGSQVQRVWRHCTKSAKRQWPQLQLPSTRSGRLGCCSDAER